MAKSSFVTHTPVLNIPLPSRVYTILYITNLILHSHLFTFTFSKPTTPSDTENYLPSDDPNITILMVSHYDCAKQHNLRLSNLLKVKQCIEAPSDIKHASVKARVYVRAKAKRIKAFKCVAYAKKGRKICFQTPFTVYQLNKMYTGTFTFMPADEKWIYDPTQNPYHSCPAHHQFEVNLVSWLLEIS